jgi:hypothetical protein
MLMKNTDQLKPNFAPVYAAALYPGLAGIFHKHGYALAVHGSLARDFDLIAVPWTGQVSIPEAVVEEIIRTFSLRLIDQPARFQIRNHGRVVYTLSCGFGECSIDLGFMPILSC